VVDFLKSLQRLSPVLENFSTDSFQSSLIFPYLEVKKEKYGKVELAIVDKVYSYRYPFYFPHDFLTYDDVYALRARIFFLLPFSTICLKKEFQIQEVFDQVGISRQKMTRLRKSIIESLIRSEISANKILSQIILKLICSTNRNLTFFKTSRK